jgi:flagellar motility protein MotE (MotC chaperone)
MLDFLIRFTIFNDIPPRLVRTLTDRAFDYARADLNSAAAADPLAWLLISRESIRDIVADELENKVSELIESNTEDEKVAGFRITVAIPRLQQLNSLDRLAQVLSRAKPDYENFWKYWSENILQRHQDDRGSYSSAKKLVTRTWFEGDERDAIATRNARTDSKDVQSTDRGTEAAKLATMGEQDAARLLVDYPPNLAGELLQDIAAFQPNAAMTILRIFSASRAGRAVAYLRPGTAASIMTTMSAPEAARILSYSDVRTAASVIAEMPIPSSAQLIEVMQVEQAAYVLANIPPVTVAALLRTLPATCNRELLHRLSPPFRAQVLRYLSA